MLYKSTDTDSDDVNNFEDVASYELAEDETWVHSDYDSSKEIPSKKLQQLPSEMLQEVPVVH